MAAGEHPCESCYEDFMKISAGQDGGSEPPAFQHFEWKRREKGRAEESANVSNFATLPCQGQRDRQQELNIQNTSGKEELKFAKRDSSAVDEDTSDKVLGIHGMADNACDESESLSDIDDVEVDGYLHNEEEKHYKKIIWEKMNKEYIEEQAAKQAAAAAAKKDYEANFRKCPEDLQAAHELAASAAVAKSKKFSFSYLPLQKRQQKRAAEARNSGPAQTAADANHRMLTKKRLSLKINYDALDKLFDESEFPVNLKKSLVESHSDIDENLPHNASKESKETPWDDELGLEEEYEYTTNTKQVYGSNLYYENFEEGYNYDDDYGYDEY